MGLEEDPRSSDFGTICCRKGIFICETATYTFVFGFVFPLLRFKFMIIASNPITNQRGGQVMEAAQASASLGGSFRGGSYALQNVNHIAHLSGALIGVVLIWLLSSVPTRGDDDK